LSKAVPKGWKSDRMGKYIREIKERNVNDEDVPVLSVTNTQGFVLSEEYFDRKVYSKNLGNYKVIRKGQFAYNPSRLNVGSLALLKDYSPMYVVFEALPDIDKEFLSYWLTSNPAKNFIKSSTQGTVRDSVNYPALSFFKINLPPLPEQQKIATILSSVDTAIEITKTVIEQTKVVKKGLMQELFTNGIPGRHKNLKKTFIGKIPDEWEVARLEDVAKVQTGIAKNKNVKSKNCMILPYLRVANVQDGFLDLSEVKHVSVDENDVKRFQLQKGDVLFTEGGDNDKLGRGCVWEAQINPCLHQNHIFAVRCSSKISPRYLSLYAASPRGKEFFLNSSKQTTNLASVNSTQLKSFPIPLPSLKEQVQIVSTLNTISNIELCGNACLKALSDIKSALMQGLLTGKLRVSITKNLN